MTKNDSPLLSAKEMREAVKDSNTVVVDARSGADAFARFMAEHPQGAVHVDLDRDLSQKPNDPAVGGRHPLPDIKKFTTLLGRLGITPLTSVVVYDDKGGANAAARFWWMLKALGHSHVKVVDGGLDALKKENIALVNTKSTPIEKSSYPADQWKLPTADIHAVAKAASDPKALVIDVREAFRYKGEREPLDLTAGHIPGAKNIPYVENLDASGKFLPAENLAERYKKELGDRKTEDVIVHCGSGVTACHTLLAMEHAGLKGAQLYVGSWSEWSRTGRDIAKGEG
jgi:thiosulfate/3-mercaptopyruvate sulfurtransferase